MCVADDLLSTVTATPWIDFVHDKQSVGERNTVKNKSL
jgi:hypothetical protein